MGNQFKNVAAMACLKTFLFAFNIVFWLSGLIMMAAGLWAEIELYKYLELSSEFSGTAPYVMIGIAGLIILISSVAFSCIIKGQPVLLYIYGGFLACIFMMEVGVGASVACYKDTFAKGLHDGLTQSLVNYNKGVTHKSADFDNAQSMLHCCGVANYTDWQLYGPQKIVPLSCCKYMTTCDTSNPEDIFQRGCFEVIVTALRENINVIVGIAIGTALFPILGTILSCCLANYVKKAKYNVIN